jgi:hypothetical protein
MASPDQHSEIAKHMLAEYIEAFGAEPHQWGESQLPAFYRIS